MSAWFEFVDLPGMASWTRIQSEEERQHALRFIDFVLARGNKVVIGERPQPKSEFRVCQRRIRGCLGAGAVDDHFDQGLYLQASEEKDVESYPLLDWFLTEQVEEESSSKRSSVNWVTPGRTDQPC